MMDELIGYLEPLHRALWEDQPAAVDQHG